MIAVTGFGRFYFRSSTIQAIKKIFFFCEKFTRCMYLKYFNSNPVQKPRVTSLRCFFSINTALRGPCTRGLSIV